MPPTGTYHAVSADMAGVEVVVPVLATAGSGNSVTGERYAKLFADLGHRSTIVGHPSGRADVVVALNAYRSAQAIHAAGDDSLVVVVLTGTDVYRFLESDRNVVLRALDRADRLVGLNDRIGENLEARHRARLDIIHEGAARSTVDRGVDPTEVSVVVVGHLRDEKDPQTVAAAVRDLPAASRISVHHYGAAHTDEWATWARAEERSNGRYRWHGEVPRDQLDAIYARSHVLVNSSTCEGGANAISEAVMAGLPILASDIPGNVGVLGDDYPAYFPVGDPVSLRASLVEIEHRQARTRDLEAAVAGIQKRLDPELERQRWSALFERMDVR
jgi:putative glycosyltransferase (TIGR04348 family)